MNCACKLEEPVSAILHLALCLPPGAAAARLDLVETFNGDFIQTTDQKGHLRVPTRGAQRVGKMQSIVERTYNKTLILKLSFLVVSLPPLTRVNPPPPQMPLLGHSGAPGWCYPPPPPGLYKAFYNL